MASQLFEEFSAVIGEQATRKLFKAKSGQRIYIPVKPKRGHWLELLIGRESAIQLCKYICHTRGMQITIPVFQGNRAQRREIVLKLVKAGATANEVSAAMGISFTTAKYHVRNARATLNRRQSQKS